MKSVFKIFTPSMMVLLLLTLVACGDQSTNASGDDSDADVSATIGVVTYESGEGAAYGEAIKGGLELAQQEINDQGDVHIELEIEDSAGETEQAISAAQKLMNDDDVSAIIGPTLSGEMQAVAPVADKNGIPILGTSTTAEGIPQIGDYVFRDSIPETMAVPAAVEAAVDEYDAETVAVMYGDDDEYTKTGYEAMEKAIDELDLDVLTTETFQKGQSDYKSILSNIKDLDPDLILTSAFYNEGAVIMKQARSAGIDTPFVGGNGFNSPEVIEIAGDSSDGLIVGTPYFAESDDPDVEEFVENYTDEVGKAPDQFAAQAYDGLYIVAEALERAGDNDRDALRDALSETEDFDGVLANISFDEDGDVVMDPQVLEIKDGEFQLFE
ncbi:MAG TPA: ABC transporter substrate-binding protein [Virgibacillus sp.]|nr:ABC transporter substrate-binding protein [Virgibacillus sp.]